MNQISRHLDIQNLFYSSSYGLLGPSGCGKTSILRAVIARMRFDSGLVRVLGKEPGLFESGIPGPLVGYMPQVSCSTN
jgi:ABC-type multidrug transport system ATPase subunit